MKPCILESFKLEPMFSSVNTFDISSNESYLFPQYKITYKYQGENESVFEDLVEFNNLAFSKFNVKTSPELNTNIKPGTYTVTASYLGKNSSASYTVTSGYDYACKNGTTINTSTKISLNKNDIKYYTFTAPTDGVYGLKNTSTKKDTSSTYVVHDKKDNALTYIQNEGYKLKKGEKYAVCIKSDKKETLIFTLNTTHTKKITKKAIAATYTHTGRTAEIKCANCGKLLQKSKTIAKKVLPTPTVTKAKFTKNKATVTWKVKKAKYTYQIQYSTDKKMKKGCKTLKVGATKSSAIINKLAKNKRYYVRIRSVIVENKKTVVGKWSNIKTIAK